MQKNENRGYHESRNEQIHHNRKHYSFNKNSRDTAKQHLWHETVKLGDNGKKITTIINDLSVQIDFYLANDVDDLTLPPFNLVSVDDSHSKFCEMIEKIVIDMTFPEQTSEYINLVISCILSLPQKHSFYIALFYKKFAQYARKDNFKESILKGITSLPQSQSVKGVKIELIEANPSNIVENESEKTSPEDYLHNLKNLVFYFFLLNKIGYLLFENFKKLLNDENGPLQSYQIRGAIRGIIDFCNLGLFNDATLITLLEKLTFRSYTPYESEKLNIIAVEAFLYLNNGIYERNAYALKKILDNIGNVLEDSRKFLSDSKINGNLINKKNFSFVMKLELENCISELEELYKTLIDHTNSTGFTSTCFIPLYNAAKLKFMHSNTSINQKLSLINAMDMKIDLKPNLWRYVYLDGYFNEDNNYETNKPPKLCLNHVDCSACLSRLKNKLFIDDQYTKDNISVDIMPMFDQFLTGVYVKDTLLAFYKNKELCCEQLLSIMCMHDSYLYILVDVLLNLLFYQKLPLLGGMLEITSITGIFAAEILFGLIILEKTIKPIILYGLSKLLQMIPQLDYSMKKNLIDCFALLLSYGEKISPDIFEMLKEFISVDMHAVIPEIYSIYNSIDYKTYKTDVLIHVCWKAYRYLNENTYKELDSHLFKLINVEKMEEYSNDFFYTVDFNVQRKTEESLKELLEGESFFENPNNVLLEFIILSKLLRLKIVGPNEQICNINETVNFLNSLENEPMLISIENLDIEKLLFEPVVQTKASVSKSEKEVKRMKVFVKNEAAMQKDVEENDNQNEKESDDMDLEDLKVSESKVIKNVEFLSSDITSFTWSIESISQLFANSLILIGSRTLTHTLKMLEFYGCIISNWRKTSITHSESFDYSLLNAITETHKNKYSRIECLILHFFSRGYLSIFAIIKFIFEKFNSIFFDFLFQKIIDAVIPYSLLGLPDFHDREIAKTISNQYETIELNEEETYVKTKRELPSIRGEPEFIDGYILIKDRSDNYDLHSIFILILENFQKCMEIDKKNIELNQNRINYIFKLIKIYLSESAADEIISKYIPE